MMIAASPWKRMCAPILEKGAFVMLFVWILTLVTKASSLQSLLDSSVQILILFQVSVFYMFLDAWLTARFGGGIGLLCTGLRVVNSNGSSLSFVQALIRTMLSNVLSSIFFPLSIYWMFRDEKHRAWHDLATDTMVIDTAGASGWGVAISLYIVISVIGALGVYQHTQYVSQNALMYRAIGSDLSTGAGKIWEEMMKEDSEKSATQSPTPSVRE